MCAPLRGWGGGINGSPHPHPLSEKWGGGGVHFYYLHYLEDLKPLTPC